jgi:hypothetical protein
VVFLECGKRCGAFAMKPIHRPMIAILLVSLAAIAQDPIGKSPFDPIRFFEGHWQGTTKGEPGDGKGKRDYEFVLGGKFLRASNKTVYPPQEKNPKGEVHEDVGYFSYDRQRKKLLLRQFHVEGFVNEYVEQEGTKDGKTLVFETERIENIPDGWRARETYKIISQDEYAEVFELAEPKKEFTVYAESHWKRVK